MKNNLSDFAAPPDDGVMQDFSDTELLAAFAARGEEAAFAEVVRRYGPLVFGAALRRTGDHSLAEEIAQNVLATLARRAGELTRHPALAAWLQKAAAYESARAVDKENNRRRLMHDYSRQQTPAAPGPDDAAWQAALPLLDGAVAALPEADRQVILLRYWQALPFKKIAEAVGGSVPACEKRAERALEKLSRLLRRRGAAVSAVVVAAGLVPAFTRASASPAVLARLTSGALTAARAAPAAGFLTTLLLMKSKLTPAALLAALIILCGTGGWVAGRSSTHSGSSRASSGTLASRIADAANKTPADPAAKARSKSLRALLQAAQHDLATADYDPAAEARAAARLAAIAPEDIRAALAFADELIAASGDSSPLAALVLGRWAEFDGLAACEAALPRKEPFLGMPSLAEPVKVWAARDPQAAFTWFRAKASAAEMKKGQGDRWKPISSLRWIMGAWSLRDLPAAVQAFTSLTDKSEIEGAMVGFQEMSGQAPGRTAILDAALARADHPANAWSDLHGILERWKGWQPAELAAWLDKSGVPQTSHDMTAKPILSGWLREDAKAAVEWWFMAPGGYPGRDQRMTTLIEAWTEADVFAAAEWLAAQPLDSSAARSMIALATKVAGSDPERGLAWALSIPDGHYRVDALKQVAATWAATDKAAATAAVNASALDDAQKAEILKGITKP